MTVKKIMTILKILIIVICIIAAFFCIKWILKSNFMPGSESKEFKLDGDVIDIGIVTWGGYAAGQYFNEGFDPSPQSRFYKEYGLKVKFHVIEDFQESWDAWKIDKIDILWTTVDAFPTQVEGLSEFNPKIFYQYDWSRGGDSIVAGPGINNVKDLAGKRIAVVFGSPSHTFILHVLEKGKLNFSDVELVEVSTAVDSANTFIAKRVQAAVVWSPDDENCIKRVKGSKILMNTKQVKYLIADAFYAKEKYIKSHREQLIKLIEGWLIGVSELNQSTANKKKAARILSRGFGSGISVAYCFNAINNVRLCTYGDNLHFFELRPCAGMTGRKLYTKMTKIYKSLRMAKNPPSWDNIIDTSILEALGHFANDPKQAAEEK